MQKNMKMKTHETILYKFRLKNVRCNDYPPAHVKEKKRDYVYLIFFLCIFFYFSVKSNVFNV